MLINELVEGMDLNNEVFYVVNVLKQTSKTSKTFLSITLQDKSGVIDAKKWEVNEEDYDIYKKGNFVSISGRISTFNNKLQISINDQKLIDLNLVDKYKFVKECPIELEVLLKKFDYYLTSIKDLDLKKILNNIFDKYYQKYIEHPAAVSNHHEFLHGLLFHSISMCDLANEIVKLYPILNYDLLISGCLLHDIGKLFELSGILGTSYTLEGNLLGHISIGLSIIKEAANEENINNETLILLEHLILSHHGKPEFGSSVFPKTLEALALSMIDDFDAKMNLLEKVYDATKNGEYTDKIFAIENRSFYKKN